MRLLLALLVGPLVLVSIAGAEPTTLRLATIAPEGSAWARELRSFARNVETARITTKDIPGNLVVERIARYEAAIDRQLYRAMAMLQHLQSRRRGDAVAHLAP